MKKTIKFTLLICLVLLACALMFATCDNGKDEISVNADGFVIVNGVTTTIVADKDDVISVDDDGFLVVNGVKTEYEVKKINHTFGDWKLYNESEIDCEKKLYYRTCPDCSTIEWKEGKYKDHNFTTVTTPATCKAKGYDTKTCNTCGKVEVCNETPVVDHDYSTEYITDNSYHWFKCINCDAIKTKAEHTTDRSGACITCNELVGATEGIIYENSADGTYVEVIGYTGNATRIRIAQEYNGKPVRSICDDAFAFLTVSEVIIPNGVTNIGERAFYYCTQLNSVYIPSTIIHIGMDAFRCSSIRNVYINDISAWCTIDFQGTYANPLHEASFFYLNGILVKDLIIPEGVTVIKSDTFREHIGFTSVAIPNSVTTIEDNAFEDCSNLATVSIGTGIETIGFNAFVYTNVKYNSFGNCKYLGNETNPYLVLMSTENSNYLSYTIHQETKVIADFAFGDCRRMTSIYIPKSITHINYSAFRYCDNLTDIYFTGAQSEWLEITIGSLNTPLTKSTIHYNHTLE